MIRRRTIVARFAVVLLAAATIAGCGDTPGGTAEPAPSTSAPTSAAPVIITLPPAAEPATAQSVPPTPVAGVERTSCRRVVHFGDSTSIGLISPSFIADPTARMPAQYQRVGVEQSRMEIDGARSIVETIPGQVNARDTAEQVRAEGFGGCWVVAMGTTDAANIARGSPIRHAERIDRMMTVIGDEPVMWVSAYTVVSSGWWSDASMREWNKALIDATARYPNIRIFDWASACRPEWFLSDGIHYTSTGSAARAHAIADALALAYPEH